MNARQTFKAEFIARCIAGGVTDPAAMAKVARDAAAGLRKASADPLAVSADAAKGVAGKVFNWGGALALAAPPILGAVAGHSLGRVVGDEDYDVEEARKQEVIDTYAREADRLRRQALVRRSGRGGPAAYSPAYR